MPSDKFRKQPMENLTEKLIAALAENRSLVLATIMTHHGSTPRTSGSRMAVLKDRSIFGTIGGGLLEAAVIDAALELMDSGRCRIQHFSLNKDIKDGIDMVCGGDLTVMLESWLPDKQTLSLLRTIQEAESDRKAGVIVSVVTNGSSRTDFEVKKAVLLHGTSFGNPILPEPLVNAIENRTFSGTSPVLFSHGLEEFIITPVPVRDTVIICGAGHVGFRLAQMAHLTDFQTIVIDDRKEFASQERFPHAAAIRVVDRFASCFDAVSVDRHTYIVILTRGHLHDQTVLACALKETPAYIGMIGSKPTRDQIYRNLMAKGVPPDQLSAVHSPIGIEIKAETPSEIAVSIMGQIIQKRACR